MHRIMLVFVMVAILFGLPQPAWAQSEISVTDIGVFEEFGQHITFQARIHSLLPIIGTSIVFRDNFDEILRRFPMTIHDDGTTSYRYDVVENVLRPFVTITFWFEVTLEDGQIHSSPNYQTQYIDSRFSWQQRNDDKVRVHWYAGDAAFGDALFDVAHHGLNTINSFIPITLESPVDVYVYASVSDLQSALFLGGENWQGGHVHPKLGVSLLAITPGPGQSIEMERLIPHELAHIMLYRNVGDDYSSLPVWLSEGMASLAELYPNPDYEQILAHASQKNLLLPISDLCNTFPPDRSGAFLAYAESQSFVQYLRDTYGTSSINSLISGYTDGLSCEMGIAHTYNTSLVNLDKNWRKSVLDQNVMGIFFRNMLPYFWLFGFLILIPLIGILKRRTKDEETE